MNLMGGLRRVCCYDLGWIACYQGGDGEGRLLVMKVYLMIVMMWLRVVW